MTANNDRTSHKRDDAGRYDFEGGWDRLCICGHTLGVHSAGSPADCLFYSLNPKVQAEQSHLQSADVIDCGCQQFRLSRKKTGRK